MPAFVSGTGHVERRLAGIHPRPGAPGLRADLRLNIHQSVRPKIQFPLAAPILASAAEGLSPLKLRQRCFLNHNESQRFDFGDADIVPIQISGEQEILDCVPADVRKRYDRISS